MKDTVTFVAASIPRFIRTARLPHLRREAIIGSWAIENKDDINLVYDVVMLPQPEFRCACTYLSMPFLSTPALRRDSFMGAYVPKDIKELAVSRRDKNPARTAARKFIKLFALDINRTIYTDETIVAASVATRDMDIPLSTPMIAAPRNDVTVTGKRRSRRSPVSLLKSLMIEDLRDDDVRQKLA